MKTKDIFCPRCQAVTTHSAEVDGNGEYVFTCTTADCGRFLKLPATVATAEEANALFEARQVQNEGQVNVEEQDKKLSGILGEEVTEQTPEE